MQNSELLRTLNYEVDEAKQDELRQFLTKLKQDIIDKIGQQKLHAELSPQMIQHFYEASSTVLQEAFDEYNPIFVQVDEEHEKSKIKLTVSGSTMLISKSAFTEGDIPHINSDTILASALVRESIRKYIPNTFAIARTKRYLLKPEDLITGLTKLINGQSGVVVVGVNLQSQVLQIIDGSGFKDQVIPIPATEFGAQDLLFIMRKEDLPAIEHRVLQQNEIDELQLVTINEDLKIYASVIDINKEENRSIRDRWSLDGEAGNQDLKVQMALAFLSVILWKDSREVIQMSVYSEYREQGIPNVLSDIVAFENRGNNKI